MIQLKVGSTSLLLAAMMVLGACGTGEKVAVVETDEAAGAAVAEGREALAASGRDESSLSKEAEREGVSEWGEPLTDPRRYYGVYANPDRPNRAWFVTEAKRPVWAEQAPDIPPGHLEIGAMFGDVAPWPMRTVSGTEFEQQSPSEYQPEPIRIEFELDEGGNAMAMTFLGDSPPEEGRLERVGDLPEEWR